MKITRLNRIYLISIMFGLFASPVISQTLTIEQNNSLIYAKQGEIVDLPGFLRTKKYTSSLNYQKVILPGPQFVISDDPEYIRVPEGIAWPGSIVRIMFSGFAAKYSAIPCFPTLK